MEDAGDADIKSYELLIAKMHFSKAEYMKCIEMCNEILMLEDIAEARDMLEKSRNEMTYEKLTNFYDILKVDCKAGMQSIKKSFMSLSLLYHPDKHVNSTEEMQIYCNKIYLKVNNAYRVLSNCHQK